jgi:hypothetical protein
MADRGNGGFVLIEVVIVLIVSSLVVVALLGGLVAIVRGLQPQNVAIRGEILPVAPTFGAFPSAIRLHETFSKHAASARAMYVLGGKHLSIPAGASATQQGPLRAQALPRLTDFSAGLPMDAKSFYDAYANTLGDAEPTWSPDDFSVVIVEPANGALAVTCLVQVRRTDATVSDGTSATQFTTREVKLWELGNDETQRYAFVERPGQTSHVFVGAVHTWMRYGVASAQQEEGPSCVVFPDPWVYAGARGGADDLPAFSRFSYFLPVSP